MTRAAKPLPAPLWAAMIVAGLATAAWGWLAQQEWSSARLPCAAFYLITAAFAAATATLIFTRSARARTTAIVMLALLVGETILGVALLWPLVQSMIAETDAALSASLVAPFLPPLIKAIAPILFWALVTRDIAKHVKSGHLR